METLGSVASVLASIRDEASAEVERLERNVPPVVPQDVRINDREARIAAAHRENRERIAQQEWEARRAIVEQREAWMKRVQEAAHQRWGGMDWTALAEEALARVPGEEVQLLCPLPLAGEGPTSRSEVAGEGPSSGLRPPSPRGEGTARHITLKTADISGGCIAISGGIAFDNSFEAREQRLESEWRRALSALYRT